MKKSALIYGWVAVLFFACRGEQSELLGEWSMTDSFVKANYLIFSEDGRIQCQVMSYRDGTTTYTYGDGEKRLFFTDLKRDGEVFVDGYSGATSTSGTGTSAYIELRLVDTSHLEVIRIWGKHQIKETWIRKE